MTVNIITPRIGRFTRALITNESSRGVDPGSPVQYVCNVRDRWGFARKAGTTALEVYRGTIQPDDVAYDPFTTSGPAPQWLDADVAPLYFRSLVGTLGSVDIALAGGYYRHDYFPPLSVTTPISLQVQYEWLQSTALYARNRNVGVGKLKTAFEQKGGVKLDVDLVATGDEVYTDLGGTKTDNTAPAVQSKFTCFNGSAKIAGIGVSSLKTADWMIDTKAQAEPVLLNSGIAGCWWSDSLSIESNIELLMATDGSTPSNNFNLLNYSNNQTPIALEYMFSNLPLASATKWLWIYQPQNVPAGETPGAGGKGPSTNKSKLTCVNRAASIPAWITGSPASKGPYNIQAGVNDVVSCKPDGGTTVNVTLAANAAKTTDQIVTELMADATFPTKFVADNFNGQLRITSLQTGGVGSLSSVQFLTGTLHSAAATLGFNNTTVNGYDGGAVWSFVNQIASYT